MSSEATIDYEALTQDAMRTVVRRVLEDTVRYGLPGDHHFYVSFDTLAPGVILSKRLRDKYAEEMTIVLQHRFWDLAVGEDYFEVKLTFDGIPERLVIPFKAIKVFFDPSVRYGLQFETVDFSDGGPPSPVVVERGDLDPVAPQDGALARPDHPPPAEPATSLEQPVQKDEPAPAPSMPLVASAETLAEFSERPDGQEEPGEEPDDGDSPKVVSLDAFRKK